MNGNKASQTMQRTGNSLLTMLLLTALLPLSVKALEQKQ